MNPVFYFIAFFFFLLSQVCMVFCALFIADYSGATGHYYWSIVFVMFLLLNELCYHSYDFQLNFDEEDDDDEWNDDWKGDDNV